MTIRTNVSRRHDSVSRSDNSARNRLKASRAVLSRINSRAARLLRVAKVDVVVANAAAVAAASRLSNHTRRPNSRATHTASVRHDRPAKDTLILSSNAVALEGVAAGLMGIALFRQ